MCEERKEREEERRREKRREEERRREKKRKQTQETLETRQTEETNDRRDRREQKRHHRQRRTTDKEEPRATITIKQQSKLPNVRFTLRDHVPRQPLLPTDPDSAVQHQFRVGRVVGGVVLQQFYSFSVQLCL
jgi:hypothetical protein